jgi:hypothetical protein
MQFHCLVILTFFYIYGLARSNVSESRAFRKVSTLFFLLLTFTLSVLCLQLEGTENVSVTWVLIKVLTIFCAMSVRMGPHHSCTFHFLVDERTSEAKVTLCQEFWNNLKNMQLCWGDFLNKT